MNDEMQAGMVYDEEQEAMKDRQAGERLIVENINYIAGAFAMLGAVALGFKAARRNVFRQSPFPVSEKAAANTRENTPEKSDAERIEEREAARRRKRWLAAFAVIVLVAVIGRVVGRVMGRATSPNDGSES